MLNFGTARMRCADARCFRNATTLLAAWPNVMTCTERLRRVMSEDAEIIMSRTPALPSWLIGEVFQDHADVARVVSAECFVHAAQAVGEIGDVALGMCSNAGCGSPALTSSWRGTACGACAHQRGDRRWHTRE